MPRDPSPHDQTRASGCWLLFQRQLTTRRILPELTDRELADVGLDRHTALREARRPWWRLLLEAWRQSGRRDSRAAQSATGDGSSGCQSLRQTTASCSRPPRSRGHNDGSATSRQPLVSR